MIKVNSYALLLALSATLLQTKAQEATSNSFSLQQSIDYAYKNSPNYLNAQNDVLMAKYKRKEVIGMAMPQIGASVDMKNFLKVPTTILPNFVAPAVYGGLVAANAAPYDPEKLDANSYDPIAAQFGTTFQAQGTVSGNLLVFSADYLVGLKATKEMIALMNIGVNRSKIDVVSQVSKAYYGVLVNRERIKLLDANMAKL
jgi:outer membrane protein